VASGVMRQDGRVEIPFGTCGVISARLIAPKRAPVKPNFARPPEVQVWNSGPMEEDYECCYGDSNEELKPIRIFSPLGGVGSGKVVVGWSKPIRGLRATAGEFRQAEGSGRIPDSAVQVRYALPTGRGPVGTYGTGSYSLIRSDALDVAAPDEVAVVTPNLSNADS